MLILLLAAMPLRATDLFDIKIQKVVDGVYVASRPEPLRPYVEGNVTIIVNEHDVVVVDAGASPRSARNVIAEIRKITPNPVRFLILTHIHRDHRFGLQEYVKAWPGLEIVAHPAVRNVIEADAGRFVPSRIARIEKDRDDTAKEIERLRAAGNEKVAAHLERFLRDLPAVADEYRQVTNLGPTATIEDRLTLQRGKRIIDIRFLGRGDTDHDLAVHLPNDGVVITGDMVVHPFPYGFSKQPREWIATMKRLAELEFDHLVPGHGDVQRGKSYLRRVIELVEAVQTPGADLSAFEREMTGGDPVLVYYFREYFSTPASEAARQ